MIRLVYFTLTAFFTFSTVCFSQQYVETFTGSIPASFVIANNASRVTYSSGTSASGVLIPNNGTASGGGNMSLRNCDSGSGAPTVTVSNINMAGRTGIKVGMLRRRTTGGNEFSVPVDLSYSIDGTNYTSLTSNLGNGAVQSSYSWADFNLGTNANNASNLRFRFTYTPSDAAACGSGVGNLRIDDFLVFYGTNPFPVSLAFFKARNLGKSNSINWQTSLETGFSHFEVQRSSDAKSFESIARVETLNTTSENKEYFYNDEKPIIGHNYYRLKMVDLDKTTRYSKIVDVFFDGFGSPVLYPNPTSHTLNLENVKIQDISSVNIFSSSGLLLKSLKPTSLPINLEGIPASNLIVEITNINGQVTKQKVVKL